MCNWESTINTANPPLIFKVSLETESWAVAFNDWSNEKEIKGDFEMDEYNKPQLLLQPRELELEVSSYMRSRDSTKGKLLGELEKGTQYELLGFGRDEIVNSKKGTWCFVKLNNSYTLPYCWIWKQSK